MTARVLFGPPCFSLLRDEESAVREEMRRTQKDPFDWSRQQVAAHHRTVYRVALAALGPGEEAEAEEVAQEAFLRLHVERHHHRFRGDSRASTWLHRVAFRLAVDRRRRPRRKHLHVGEEHLEQRPAEGRRDDPFERSRQAETAASLKRAITRLSEMQQTVIRLHYWLDASVEEISNQMGLPAGTVKSHLHRARAALAELLGGRL